MASAAGGNTGNRVGSLQGDAFASHKHNLIDPGHGHVTNDPGHGHGVTVTPHNHGINDPGHAHRLPRRIIGDCHGGYGTGGGGGGCDLQDLGIYNVESSKTGLTLDSTTVSVSVNSNKAGVTVSSASTGITLESNGGGETRPKNVYVNWIIRVK